MLIPGSQNNTDPKLLVENQSNGENTPIKQYLLLQPNSAYIYEIAAIINNGDVALLYWSSQEGDEGKLTEAISNELELYRYVFITPNWDSAKRVLLAPLVFLGQGKAEIHSIRFYSFETGP
jgi:hypothetical protein